MARPMASMSAVGLSCSKWTSSPKPTMAWVSGGAGGPALLAPPLGGRLLLGGVDLQLVDDPVELLA